LEKNFQCALCGHYWENVTRQPDQCPDCGCKMVREVQKGTMDSVSPESTAHLRRRMENCPNYDVDVRTGAASYHRLELDREIDLSHANLKLPPERASVIVRDRCRHCKILYNQANIPLSRPDVLERMGVLSEVESKLGWHPQ
jgi:predicted  nucleic acid-binding Zn-ribbon protein